MERLIEQLKEEKLADRRSIDDRLKKIEDKITPKVHPLDALNSWNQSQLMKAFKRSTITPNKIEKLAEAVCQARSQKSTQKFEDYNDFYDAVRAMDVKVGRGNVLSEKTFREILNALSPSE